MPQREEQQMSYVDEVLKVIAEKNPDEPEFCQAVKECLNAVRPLVDANEEVYRENAILERITEPDRMIVFSVPWIDRNGKVQVNRGWRVQFNNAIGTYKGGLRFHRTVNTSIMKCLAFEMILKNSLTGLPMGGAKGGADFDPAGPRPARRRPGTDLPIWFPRSVLPTAGRWKERL